MKQNLLFCTEKGRWFSIKCELNVQLDWHLVLTFNLQNNWEKKWQVMCFSLCRLDVRVSWNGRHMVGLLRILARHRSGAWNESDHKHKPTAVGQLPCRVWSEQTIISRSWELQNTYHNQTGAVSNQAPTIGPVDLEICQTNLFDLCFSCSFADKNTGVRHSRSLPRSQYLHATDGFVSRRRHSSTAGKLAFPAQSVIVFPQA